MATVSSSFDYNPTVDQIIKQGAQLAGVASLGRNLSAMELSDLRDHLNVSLKSLSAIGGALTQMERTTLALVAGTQSYVLAADTIEVDFPMMILPSGGTSETQVERMGWQQFQEISMKTSQGTPINCYAEKQATVTLLFWPVPNAAYTLTYRRQRLVRNGDSGTNADLTQRWYDALVYMMAHKISLIASNPLGRSQELKKLADEKIEAAMGRENEGGDIQFILPDGGWC